MARQSITQMRKAEYMRERRRVQALVRRWEKRGLVFDSNPIPQIPKIITPASVRRLKGITAKSLETKAHAISPVSGEKITAKRAKLERARIAGAKRSAEATFKRISGKNITSQDYDKLSKIVSKVPQDTANAILDKVSKKFDEQRLREIAEDFENKYGRSLPNTIKDVRDAEAFISGYESAVTSSQSPPLWEQFARDEAKRLNIPFPEGKTEQEVTNYLNQWRDINGEPQDRWLVLPEDTSKEINELTGEVRPVVSEEEIDQPVISSGGSTGASIPDYPDTPVNYETYGDYDYSEAPEDLDWVEHKLDSLVDRLNGNIKNVAQNIIGSVKDSIGSDAYYNWVADNIDAIEDTIGDLAKYSYASPAITMTLAHTLTGGRALTAAESEQLNDAVDGEDFVDYDV